MCFIYKYNNTKNRDTTSISTSNEYLYTIIYYNIGSY